MLEFSGGFTLNFFAVLHYPTFQMRWIFAVFRGGKMPSLGQDFFPAFMGVKNPAGARKKVPASGVCFSPPRTAKIHLLRLEDISCLEECKIPV